VAGSEVAGADSIVGIVPMLQRQVIAGHERRCMLYLDSRTAGESSEWPPFSWEGEFARASLDSMRALVKKTSVNAKPNDPLRTFHEAALNYGVDITKTDPAVSWWILWQTSGIIGRTSGFARGSRFKLQCTLRQIAEP
jgi:hypothetical protein